MHITKYLIFFRIRFLNGLQYRAAAWAGAATQFVWGSMYILMYRAFYTSGQTDFPMTFPALVTYVWLQQSLLALVVAWYYDNEIFDSISNGNIAYELCRPADIYTLWFIKNLAVRVSRVVLRCAPILLIAALLPAPYNISLPASPEAGLMFLISLMLGALVVVAFYMLIYISAFYTISSLGVRTVATNLVLFFAGAIIPLPFFPEKIRTVFILLPFASMQNAPFQIYNGYINGADIYKAVLIQLIWLIILLISGKLWIKKALKRVVVQGG